ncbi:dihydroorotate dehydrogenase [candidate division KSB1 bacterium]|nr:dihydroorotate dehydrogenase [candidate division KSB1 bacterium]
MSDLSVNIGDLRLANPILAASGTFGYGSEVARLYDVNILGGIVTKTITRAQRPGNPPDRLAETPSGILNSIGLANVGIDNFISDKLPFLRSLSTSVIVNIAGESIDDFLFLIDRLEEHQGIDGYELNLSCPNVAGGLDFGIDPKLAGKIVKETKKRSKKCIIPKLTPNITDIAVIAKAVEDNGADAISLINTIVGMSVNVSTKRPKLGEIMGGLSGPAIRPVALAMVYKARKAVKIPLIGIGGISSVNDVLEFLITGASAVQIGTFNFVNPKAPIEILKELEQYLETNNFTSVKELSGSLITR